MITVLGASGFVGRHIVDRLEQAKIEYQAPSRDANLTKSHLGTIIYCIGLTADFRIRPFDTIEAHICKLKSILELGNFNRLIYLSSARVYNPGLEVAEETVSLQVNSSNPSDLYNLSKLTGEAIALQSGRNVCVVRLSNVYGYDMGDENFLPSILRDAVMKSRITLYTTLNSVKDYINIEDVVVGLMHLTNDSKHTIYNLASGKNVSNQQLVARISELTDAVFTVSPDAVTSLFPTISIQRMQDEFDFSPSSLLDALDTLITQYKLRQK
jgi:nucleoside-diphosphate-sugar epimerase